MDKVIAQYKAIPDDDLMLCFDDGVAYQTHMPIKTARENYFDYCNKKYKNKEFNEKVNAARMAFIHKHYGPWGLLDIGIGNGSFIKKYNSFNPMRSINKAFGWDIDKNARKWLSNNGLLATDLSMYNCYTMWDVLEHLHSPSEYFKYMNNGDECFLSIPIIENLCDIRNSKHYRPDEHLYYFTEPGLIQYMERHGLYLIAHDDFEIKIGRADIYSYCFEKNEND